MSFKTCDTLRGRPCFVRIPETFRHTSGWDLCSRWWRPCCLDLWCCRGRSGRWAWRRASPLIASASPADASSQTTMTSCAPRCRTDTARFGARRAALERAHLSLTPPLHQRYTSSATHTHTTHAPEHTHARGSVFSPRLALRTIDPTRQPPHASGLPIRPNPHSPDPRINTLMPSPTYLRRSSLRDLRRRRRPKSSRS